MEGHNWSIQLFCLVAILHKNQDPAPVKRTHRIVHRSSTIWWTSIPLWNIEYQRQQRTYLEIFRNILRNWQVDDFWNQRAELCHLQNWTQDSKHHDSLAIISIAGSFNSLKTDGRSTYRIRAISREIEKYIEPVIPPDCWKIGFTMNSTFMMRDEFSDYTI